MVQDQRFLPPQPPYPMHECGIFAVFGHPNAAVLTYYGLFALQHRGQESAGIVTSNGPGSSFQLHRDMGLVSQVFGQDELERLKGHARGRAYSLFHDRLEHGRKTRSPLWSIASAASSRSRITAT